MEGLVRSFDGMPGATHLYAPCWTIARGEGRHEVLTVWLAEGEALPIFSLEEEARSFLRLRASAAEGWELREIGLVQLVGLLSGPCGGIERVVLDPPPGELDEVLFGLLSVGRRIFVESLLGRGRAGFEDSYIRERGTYRDHRKKVRRM